MSFARVHKASWDDAWNDDTCTSCVIQLTVCLFAFFSRRLLTFSLFFFQFLVRSSASLVLLCFLRKKLFFFSFFFIFF